MSLKTVSETAVLISKGRHLLLAGDEALLSQLPAGSWIAGTIPYFMDDDGGTVTRDRIFVDELPPQVTDARITTYAADELERIPADGFANGFTVVILPATSEAHSRYAADAPDIKGLFDRPVVGWVSGVHLDDLGKMSPKVFAGSGGSGTETRATVLHAELPDGVLASVDIVNLFTQGDGPVLTFDATGFSPAEVKVDGVRRVFSEYLEGIDHDVRLPLVADYFGAMVNVSIQSVPADGGRVTLYAPVFDGIEYRIAAPVRDYVSEFAAQLPTGTVSPTFSCNCILNFLYADLEGKRTGDVLGPITFGEVAYQLLNQTLVYLTIHD
jgi:hypothetical protein